MTDRQWKMKTKTNLWTISRFHRENETKSVGCSEIEIEIWILFLDSIGHANDFDNNEQTSWSEKNELTPPNGIIFNLRRKWSKLWNSLTCDVSQLKTFYSFVLSHLFSKLIFFDWTYWKDENKNTEQTVYLVAVVRLLARVTLSFGCLFVFFRTNFACLCTTKTIFSVFFHFHIHSQTKQFFFSLLSLLSLLPMRCVLFQIYTVAKRNVCISKA